MTTKKARLFCEDCHVKVQNEPADAGETIGNLRFLQGGKKSLSQGIRGEMVERRFDPLNLKHR